MTKMTKTVLARIWWLGRGTATMMGIAVMLALTVGLASTALAGTGIGARLDLGKANTVNAVTRLTGSLSGASLKIDNNSTGTGATALRLEVEPGKPPMSLNSSTKVEGLNVDSLDGRDSSDFALRDPETGAAFAANEAVNALIARNADRLDGKDSTQFASGTNGKANDADRLDGVDSTAFFSGKTYETSKTLFDQGPGDQIHSVRATCDPGDTAIGGGHVFVGTNSVVDMGSGTTRDAYFLAFKGSNQVNLQVTCADFPPLR